MKGRRLRITQDRLYKALIVCATGAVLLFPGLAFSNDKAGAKAHMEERRDSIVGDVDNKKVGWNYVEQYMDPGNANSWTKWDNNEWNNKKEGKFVLGNPNPQAVDDTFKIHFEHFSDDTKSPTVGGKNDEPGMEGEQTDRCNHSEEYKGKAASRTHQHSWEDLQSEPVIHYEACRIWYEYVPPDEPGKGYRAGICRKCFPNPFCPQGCFWYDADLVEYILPTHKINVSNHPFYSRYMYKTKEQAEETTQNSDFASHTYFDNNFVDDPEKEVPPPGNPDLQDPDVDDEEDIIIRELQFHVEERNKKPRQKIHDDPGNPNDDDLDIDDDRAVHLYKELAKTRVREEFREHPDPDKDWKTKKIDDRIDDIDEDIPDEREKLITLPVFKDVGQNNLAWTKDKRGFARHFGEPEVQTQFIPSSVPNFWPKEPYLSTEKHSYLISYWLTESNRKAQPNPITHYGTNVGGGGNAWDGSSKYTRHMEVPETCVRENLASGKTPSNFDQGGFKEAMNRNTSDYDIDNEFIELDGGLGVDFPEKKPAWGRENNWMRRYCLSRVGELFPHTAWRRPHLSDHIWQTGFKTLTEYHTRVPWKAERHTFRLDIDRIHMLPGKYSADDVGLDKSERELNDRIIDDLAIGSGVGIGNKPALHDIEKDYQCRLLKDTIYENHKYNMTNLEYETENNQGDTQQGETSYELMTHFAGCWAHRGWDKVGSPSMGFSFWDMILRDPQVGHQFVSEELRFW